MTTGLSDLVRHRAVRDRNKKFDGVFCFAKVTGVYCHPSCPAPHPLRTEYLFFNTASEAILHGYHACGRCHLSQSKDDVSMAVMDGINTGAINDHGVNGFAHSLHISERHLRRIVQKKTGTSPTHLNREKRLNSAKQLVISTRLPITDVAFSVGFSSLRQFNTVFKNAFNVTPREMRKSHSTHILGKHSHNPAFSLRLTQRKPFA